MNSVNEGIEEGFARYVIGARPALRRNAFLLVGDWHAADDLVQQTLITLYRRWEHLDQHDKLSGYTRTVMVRLFLSDRRNHRWTRERLVDSTPEPEPTPAEAARIEDRIVLLDALATLSAKQRSLVYLRYWEDLSVEESARIMNCSSSTVRSSSSRALRILRERLGDLTDRQESPLSGH
ncbi:SigE family RNA polymerase sigma factor [Streptomyces sp. NPDC056835]|uniref:SigE family RNA polymerase sigma factor n=1 Tax=Streptomyces sp. NPDC056835 TaxID=3345956 RepID=UPI0036BB749C